MAAIPESERWPEYCCAILRDAAGRYLLEHRPPEARAAAGLITCFGGTRHTDEHPDACIRRELREELGVDFTTVELTLRVRLVGAAGEVIAWFYTGPAPEPGRITAEPGIELVWTLAHALTDLPLSPWHRAALDAERAGRPTARVARAFAG